VLHNSSSGGGGGGGGGSGGGSGSGSGRGSGSGNSNCNNICFFYLPYLLYFFLKCSIHLLRNFHPSVFTTASC